MEVEGGWLLPTFRILAGFANAYLVYKQFKAASGSGSDSSPRAEPVDLIPFDSTLA